MATLVQHVTNRDALGGARFIAEALRPKWVEKRLAKQLGRSFKSRSVIPDPSLVAARFERHPLVAAFYAQLLAERVAAQLSADFTPYTAELAMVDYLGAHLERAALHEPDRLRNRLRDPTDALAVCLEGLTASAYRKQGCELEPVLGAGPEYFVVCDESRVAVECKTKLGTDIERADEAAANRILSDVASGLFELRRSLHVEIDPSGDLDGADAPALLDRIRSMLDLAIGQADACNGRYTIRLLHLPDKLNELPKPSNRSALRTAVWEGGRPPRGIAEIGHPLSVAVTPPDRSAERAEGVRRSLHDALGNLPEAGPSVVYIGLPMMPRERAYDTAESILPTIERELATAYRRLNAVVLVAVSKQDIDLANAALFVDAWTTRHPDPRTALPSGFKLVDREVLQEQQWALLEATAREGGRGFGTLSQEETAEMDVFMPTSDRLR